MKKLILLLLLLVAPLAKAQTTYYIDYASGSNSNNGTSKVTPWKSHPYMQNVAGCAGAPHAYSHVAGDHFIFKGGVTWPAACFNMNISQGGNSGAPDYYGVDLTWFTGGAFTRPIFDMAGTAPVGTPFGNSYVMYISGPWVTIDNLEIKRQLISDPPGTSGGALIDCGIGFDTGAGGINGTVKNALLHDWTTTTMNNGFSNCAGGIGRAMLVDTVTVHDAAGTPVPFGGCFANTNEIKNSICHDVGQGVNGYYLLHDSQFYNLTDACCIAPFSNSIHTNVIQDTIGGAAVTATYNNLIHDNHLGQVTGICPNMSFYNNVMWNNSGANSDIQVDTGVGGCLVNTSTVANVYNNTVDCSNGVSCFRSGRAGTTIGTINLKNNHWITNGTPVSIENTIISFNQSNNLPQPTATATSQGYTVANKYRAAGSTVGAGVNLTSSCSGGLAALCQDTEGTSWFGATSVARPTGSTAWDAGAYQSPFSGGGSPPTVTVTAPAAGTVSGTITITVTASGGTISSIQPLVDGNTFGNACTASPCSVLWNTTLVGNGTHTVGGTATNGSGQGTATPVTVTVNNSTPGCTTGGPTWTSTSFTSQTGSFTATVTITPNGTPPAGSGGPVFALSQNVPTTYSDNAVLIRQSENGFWEAYNSAVSGYTHTGSVSWIIGTPATFTLSPNIGAQTYSVQVTQNSVTTTIATGFGFRVASSSLSHWNLDPQPAPATLQACNFTLGATGALTPTSFNYGTVNVGASLAQVFTLTNNGGSPLTVSAYTASPSVFTITANGCTSPIAPAASCPITVTFTPSGPTSFSGTLHLTTTGTINDSTLTGLGSSLSAPTVPTNPSAIVSGANILFTWTASTGTTPITYTVSYGQQNGGPYPTQVTGITATSYTLVSPPNGTYYFVVSATNAAGTSANSTQASATVSTSPILQISPSPLNFGTVGIGTSGSQLVNFFNIGNANLTLTCPGGIVIVGADFTIATNGCTSPVAPGSSFGDLITFTPSATGTRTGTLTVTSNSPTSPDSITLTGFAQGLVTCTPTSVNFGRANPNKVGTTQVVTCANNSGSPISISAAISTGDSTQFTLGTNTCTGTIANGANCTTSMTFTPTSTGSKASSLIYTFTGAPGSPITIPLAGTAVNRKIRKGVII